MAAFGARRSKQVDGAGEACSGATSYSDHTNSTPAARKAAIGCRTTTVKSALSLRCDRLVIALLSGCMDAGRAQ